MKRAVSCMVLLFLINLIIGCSSGVATPKDAKKMKVVTTVYPVYEFTKQIGGDKLAVTLMTPSGAEPHDWEPTAKDLVKIREAKLFIYQGNGFEPWVEKMLTQNKTTAAIAASNNIPTLAAVEDEDSGQQGQATADPHVWLDPVLAMEEVKNIRDALISADDGNATFYTANADKLIGQLADLDNQYRVRINQLKNKDIVTTHAAFAYLAKRYGLNQVPLMGLAPDAEPTPEKIAQVAAFCKKNDVHVIFFETLVSPKLAEMMSKESGAATLVLNPIEGLTDSDMKAGKDYFSIMRENLANIETALK
jgi:zinc transport system substrate-binding protein